MKFDVPWNVKGIGLEARETARDAARRSGMSLGEWLNSLILQQAPEQTATHEHDDETALREFDNIYRRLDALTDYIEQFTAGATANVQRRTPQNWISEAGPLVPQSFDVESGGHSRDRRLSPSARMHRHRRATTPIAASNEDFSGLQDQLRRITDQIETLRRPGVEEAIVTLRDELGNIGRAVHEALPRNAVEKIERQIQGIAAHAASNETVNGLAAQIALLADKIQQGHGTGDGDAFARLENKIVGLFKRLDTSDARLKNLDDFKHALSSLLGRVEDLRIAQDIAAAQMADSSAVEMLKNELGRANHALETIGVTIAKVFDRITAIESELRNDGQRSGEESAARLDIAPQAVSNDRTPDPTTYIAKFDIPDDFAGDRPLEPGSGPPLTRVEKTFGASQTVTPVGSGSSFIAAARRAAQTAMRENNARTPLSNSETGTEKNTKASTLRNKLMRHAKSLILAASIVLIVVGTIQIVGHVVRSGSIITRQEKHTKISDTDDTIDHAVNTESQADDTLSFENELQPDPEPQNAPTPPENSLINPPVPPAPDATKVLGTQSLFDPSVLNAPEGFPSGDNITGSIPRASGTTNFLPLVAPSAGYEKQLPVTIGGKRLRDAAMNGDAAAAYTVALRYAEGRGVPTSLEEAARWYARAAEKGLAPAQFRYASMLEKGQGVKRDLAQARRLYRAAATKGHAKAMHNLAVLYAEGIEGKPDYSTAAVWFRKAANHGIADSQYNLGVLTARGLGIEKDLTEAYKWFALAANQGDKEAVLKRDELASEFDADELATAKKAVQVFTAAPQPDAAVSVPVPAGGWDNVRVPTAQAKPAGNLPVPLNPIATGRS